MLLVTNIACLLTGTGAPVRGASLLVGGDGRILAAGADTDIEAPAGCETLDAAGCAVLPGFINAHTHLWQLTIMGLKDDLPLAGWCESVLTPYINALYTLFGEQRARAAYCFAGLGVCMMLKSGVTAFLDMDLNYAQDAMQKAASDAGVRGFFGVELADRFLPDASGLSGDAREIERLLEAYPGRCVLTPSEINLCSDAALSFAADAAKKSGARVQMHVDETRAEARQAKTERGTESLFALDARGLLSPAFSAVHGVYLSDAEIALARKRGITLVYNPKSNMKLGSGVCPVRKLLDAGVNVALATDGPGSNDRLDLFEELRAGALLQRAVSCDPAALTAEEMLHMATAGGARMLGLNAGALLPGMDADFIVLPLDKPHLLGAARDPAAALVHCAASGDVRDAFVRGRPVMRDYRVSGLDEAALLQEFTEILDGLSKEVY